MKNITVFLLFLFFSVCNIYATESNVGFLLGATYNPLNSDYILRSIGSTFAVGEKDANSAWITDLMFSFGVITYRYETSNPFTVQEETTELWSKGGIGEFGINVMYQYVIKGIVGLRVGGGASFLWSFIFAGVKPGLSKNNNFPINMAFNGIVGISIFPEKQFPVVLSISPGFFFDPYGSSVGILFCTPISLTFNMMSKQKK
jgi:hypothetical protein